MLKRKLVKIVQSLLRQVANLSRTAAKRVTRALMRTLMARSRQANLHLAGFVLPTVTMVMLVVVLLTVAITLRSFDRLNNARNFKIDQQTLAAATPALDRAKAKINALLSDPNLPRTTPSDYALYNVLKGNPGNTYNFDDEVRLKIGVDLNGGGIQAAQTATQLDVTLYEDMRNAWKFPVDTDGDGKFDSYTLYSILFRSPSRNATGDYIRQRNILEARTPPMPPGGSSKPQCQAALGTSTSVIGDSDWYKSEGRLKKSFFVYAVTVPIATGDANLTGANANRYQIGKNAFSAVEYQQDRSRIPLSNNAVWFEGDIEISNVTNFNLNGRVFTNSNLMVTGFTGNANGNNPLVNFFQVSDPQSCYYEAENSKIVVAGNVANGDLRDTADAGLVAVHRYTQNPQPPGNPVLPGENNTPPGINGANKTTNATGGAAVGYNTAAYNTRISAMVTNGINLVFPGGATVTDAGVAGANQYAQEVQVFYSAYRKAGQQERPALTNALTDYFQERTRKVPYSEVAFGVDPVNGTGPPYTNAQLFSSNTPLTPLIPWMTVQADATVPGSTAVPNLTLQNIAATDPQLLLANPTENSVGDRVIVGNGLPARWYAGQAGGNNVFNQDQDQQILNPAATWNNANGTPIAGSQRYRQTQVNKLPNLGGNGRDEFWELEAATNPKPGANTGGLRVVTGAGIFIDNQDFTAGGVGQRYPIPTPLVTPLPVPTANQKSFLPPPPTVAQLTAQGIVNPGPVGTAPATIVVWPDTMPMWGDINFDGIPNAGDLKGDLQMRASAVYHYRQNMPNNVPAGSASTDMTPIGCVSSYYDPSTPRTARNQAGLPDVSGGFDTNGDGIINTLADGSNPPPPFAANPGLSNNGVTYAFNFYTDPAGRIAAAATFNNLLSRQASMIYPNGRLVNQPLRQALIDINNGVNPLTQEDSGAIDSAICALGILGIGGTTLTPSTAQPLPVHGTIKEATFLDGRQVKALNRYQDDPTGVATPTLNESQVLVAETTADLNTPARVNTPNRYNLQFEQRQPQEIRVTELDLNLLRQRVIGAAGGAGADNTQEFLLPNSGLIYATRDDALPDLSNATNPNAPTPLNTASSPTDFQVDPSARPNGIRLINGSNLSRTQFFRRAEKGLIMATNLPIYVKADPNNNGFNLHQAPGGGAALEEFNGPAGLLNTAAATFWNNFYQRGNSNLNTSFACRQNQPGCTGNGDQWRPATIIADAVTLLSGAFRDGFRNQGDFDLRNNAGNVITGALSDDPTTTPPNAITRNSVATSFLKNGFWFNNFVTSANWVNPNAADAAGRGFPFQTTTASAPNPANNEYLTNSYLANGVTPIQRRAQNLPEYLMEVCPKLPVSQCGPTDWYIDPSIAAPAAGHSWDYTWANVNATTSTTPDNPANFFTTARLPTTAAIVQRFGQYPRRVAFRRATGGNLANAGGTALTLPIANSDGLVPLGINGTNVQTYPLDNTNTTPPLNATNYGLWFQTLNGNNFLTNAPPPTPTFTNTDRLLIYGPITALTDQPLLVPMLQIHDPTGTPGAAFNGLIEQRWLQEIQAAINRTTYNATFVSRNTSSRPAVPAGANNAEAGGGLPNFVRQLEKWRDAGNNALTIAISGNFIQSGDSLYANAPFQAADPTTTNTSLFYTTPGTYLQPNAGRGIPTNNTATDWVYPTSTSNARASFFRFGLRAWGFDVGLLSQTPDLFAQRFTGRPATAPNEYFRGVDRNDPWVSALLCAGQASDRVGGPKATYTDFAVSAKQRPSTCQGPTGYPANPDIPQGG